MRTKAQRVAISAMLGLLGIFQIVTGIVERNYLRIVIGAILVVVTAFAVVKRLRASS